jgi:hypothetical protein
VAGELDGQVSGKAVRASDKDSADMLGPFHANVFANE